MVLFGNVHTDERVEAAHDKLTKHLADGMPGGTLDIANSNTWVEQMIDLAMELDDSSYEVPDTNKTNAVLKQLTKYHRQAIEAYKSRKAGVTKWKDDFDDVWDELQALLESFDADDPAGADAPTDVLTTTTNAIAPEVTQLTTLVTTLQATIDQQQKQISILLTNSNRNGGKGGGGGGNYPPKTNCPDCGRKHALDGTYGCIGKAIFEGEITAEEAGNTAFSRAKDPIWAAEAARKSYITHQVDKTGKAPERAAKPAEGGDFRPGKTKSLLTVTVATTDVSRDGAKVIKVDTQADITMFNDPKFFVEGINTDPEFIMQIGGIAGAIGGLINLECAGECNDLYHHH